jgi:hypothetical protein
VINDDKITAVYVKLQNCRNIKEVIEGVKATGYRAHHPFYRDCRIDISLFVLLVWHHDILAAER